MSSRERGGSLWGKLCQTCECSGITSGDAPVGDGEVSASHLSDSSGIESRLAPPRGESCSLGLPPVSSQSLLPPTHESAILTHGVAMRTNIDIDDDLMREAMRASGATTKRAVVEQGLRMLIQVRGQRAIGQLRGKVKWTGDLNASRLGRTGTNR